MRSFRFLSSLMKRLPLVHKRQNAVFIGASNELDARRGTGRVVGHAGDLDSRDCDQTELMRAFVGGRLWGPRLGVAGYVQNGIVAVGTGNAAGVVQTGRVLGCVARVVAKTHATYERASIAHVRSG